MKWLTLLFTIFIVVIIFLANTGNLGILAIVFHIPFADKLGHFILYGILAFLVNRTLFQLVPSRSRNWIVLGSGLTLALLIGFEELSQLSFPTRTFDLIDLGASYLGMIFFSWLATKTAKG
ncbi:MAG TPA: VanZ family protein [Anaerolineales bacterium]|jgi:VanZ family protein|nr:VanZ family protein [Anaerolineales bacterium]